MYDAIEAQAHHRINERVSRAAEPRVPPAPSRHRLAERLRRIADRLDD